MSGEQKRTEPQVGIFWLMGRRLIVHGVRVAEAECWGQYRNAVGHEDYWTDLRRVGKVPAELAYDEAPRGRVVYDTIHDRFHLYADRCILDRPLWVQRVLARLNLSGVPVEIDADRHYRCSGCLRKSGAAEEDP